MIPSLSARPRFVAVAGLLAVLGCGGEAPLGFPFDVVFGSRELLVAPGRRWRADARRDAWSFAASATLAVWVGRAPAAPLTLFLRPDPASAGFVFRLLWDGQPWEEVTLPESGLTVSLPATELTAGVHRLTLQRVYRDHDRGAAVVRENVFAELRYRTGEAEGEWTALRSAEEGRHRALGDFLLLGVAGSPESRRRESGALFDGPQRQIVELRAPGRGTLWLRATNLSDRPAVFAAATTQPMGETRRLALGAGDAGRLGLPVAAGRVHLQLEVEGEAAGLYLWGAPHVEGVQARRAGARVPIVLVTLDTTRRDALAPYGADPALTPTLQRLAAGATVYERAYSTAPWTLPAHASMFTGLYPSRHGAGVMSTRLEAGRPTLAERLRSAGYATAGFAGGALCAHDLGLARGFAVYRDPDGFETAADRLTDHVEALLDEVRGGPLFLFVNYFDPHSPYQAPEAYQARAGVEGARAALPPGDFWRQLARGEPGPWATIALGGTAPPAEGVAYLRAAYAAEVAFMDAELGRLLDTLRRLGLYDQALIAVVADHGELLGEDGHYSHMFRLDPELTEVPLLVKWPHQTSGARSDALVSVADLFPTLLAAAGLEPPASDGLELPRGPGERRSRRPYVLFEEHASLVHPRPRNGVGVADHLLGVQRRRHRQVVWEGGEECRAGGPGAWRPVPCRLGWREVLAALRAILAPAAGAEAEELALTPEERARLEALGYL